MKLVIKKIESAPMYSLFIQCASIVRLSFFTALDRYLKFIIVLVPYAAVQRYEPVDFQRMNQNTRIDHRLKNYLTGDFAELTLPPPLDTMKAESVRSGCNASNDA